MSAPLIALAPEQLDELSDQIAHKLAVHNAGELIAASELSERLGVGREWIYGHAERLGAIRLGDGPRPRLKFRWPHVLDRLERSPTEAAPLAPAPAARARRPRKADVELLPIRGLEH